jgi:hypothetical protein
MWAIYRYFWPAALTSEISAIHLDYRRLSWFRALSAMSAWTITDPRLIRERIPRLSYRSIRGRPNCGKTLLSANHVIAEI